jgi:hypothetical protein
MSQKIWDEIAEGGQWSPEALAYLKRAASHFGEQPYRYPTKFDCRYNNRAALEVNDVERTRRALSSIGGKRLTYRRPDEA